MKIALIGYGKMGKTIERLAIQRGHAISRIIDLDNQDEIKGLSRGDADVVIEFSRPDAAFYNISAALRNGLTVISGTTGWLARLDQIRALVVESGGTFLHSSNYSLGVNLFIELNKFMASNARSSDFKISMQEVHHLEKLDAPSGTAIRVAEEIIDSSKAYTDWSGKEINDESKIFIQSVREPDVPGTHTVKYASALESIEIKHTAHSRDVFAAGAIDVAEWIKDKKGFLTMSDYVNDKH